MSAVVSTDVLAGSRSTPDTVQIDDLYGRPPPPYELVGSRVRLAHFPRVKGDCTMTVGILGFDGFSVTVLVWLDAGLLAHAATVDLQSALTFPTLRMIRESAVRYGELEESITGGNEMLTVVEFSQEQSDFVSPLKTKSSEQFHTALVIPALSVGASNLTITTCPLSENLENSITGAGVAEEGDRRTKGVDTLLY